MSEYKQNEVTRPANKLTTSILQQRRLNRISEMELIEFKSMCRAYAKEKEMIFDETRQMFYIEDTKA